MAETTRSVLRVRRGTEALDVGCETILLASRRGRDQRSATGSMAIETETAASKELLSIGNGAYLRGQLDAALSAYARCVSVGEFPWACDCAVNLASVVLDRDGDQDGAELLYRAALASAKYGNWPVPEPPVSDPPANPAASYFHVDAAHNLANLLQTRAAKVEKIEVRRALLREAAGLYRDVVRSDDSRWDAWANLGSAMLDAGAPRLDAAKCLQRAILSAEKVEAEYEANNDGRLSSVLHALATAYYGLGTALGHLTPDEERAACADSDLVLLGDSTDDDPAAVVAESASNALRTAVALAGRDHKLKVMAEHALAAVKHDGMSKTRASPAFVRALFDEFAATFDEQLLNDLDYHVPELLADSARRRMRSDGYKVALDAGCGTGLLGLSGLPVSQLVGADLSTKMCQAARMRRFANGTPVYDTVIEGDLLDPQLYMQALGENKYFDLIAAADVLCYFGDLRPLLALWSAALKPDGDAIFTVEALSCANPAWELTSSGRYAHSTAHVAEAAQEAGLTLVETQPIVARLERGEPVNSTLCVLHKKVSAAAPRVV